MNGTSDDRAARQFPLAVGPTGRHLVDAGGAPFLVHGDTAWSLIVAATKDDAERYLENRRGKGVNAVIVNLIERRFAQDPPRNVYGHEPFTTPGDFSTPNDDYFAHADWVLAKAAKRGIVVMLAPAYLGYRDPHWEGYRRAPEGWYAEVLENGVEKCREYGRYLGRRYRGFDNIVWVMSGDRCPGLALEHVRAMVTGIRSEDASHRLFTAHVHPEHRAVEEYPDDSWLTVTQTYTYAIIHRKLLVDYSQEPARPNVLFESTYENDFNASPLQIRRQAYWALLCGGCGQFFGNTPLWNFSAGWQDQLESPGSVAMTHLLALMAPRRWWELVPDQGHVVVTDGIGELNGLDFCAAAMTPDGSLAMAYIPTPRTITVDMTALVDGRVTASWFDPLTGASVASGWYHTTGRWPFTPPWNHDAVLVLEAEPALRPSPAPAPVEQSGRARAEGSTADTKGLRTAGGPGHRPRKATSLDRPAGRRA